MPLKVYVSHGQSVENIIDPSINASAFNVDNRFHWTDLAANLFEHPEQLSALPIAQGYFPEYYQAALAGISEWKLFEKEGLFSFVFTDDPSDADIYVFWVNHFVDKLGLALFANDIRGYTAMYSNFYRAILSGAPVQFKPVITLLRTTNQRGEAMPLGQMQAASAHEFGHALGIDGHSTNPQDLMSIYYGRGVISPNDAATIRHLYHLTPDLVP
jgi:predicted Zn-dependent protease